MFGIEGVACVALVRRGLRDDAHRRQGRGVPHVHLQLAVVSGQARPSHPPPARSPRGLSGEAHKLLVRRENMPALPASHWSAMRIFCVSPVSRKVRAASARARHGHCIMDR
eukprot:6122027-Pyramimonas_sp.AAC.1